MLASFSLQQHQFLQINQTPNYNNYKKRRKTLISVRCSEKPRNYYDILGVPLHSSAQEIKDAYRKLQKKYHPDIAGEKGHDSTLKLNQAYKVLMREDLRKEYDALIGKTGVRLGRDFVGSKWKGPLRPQALFVDENSCIGCRECMYHARNTFVMDEAFGTARVEVQFGDDEEKIETSVDSCPVNCIHWVNTDELEALEHLIKPQPKNMAYLDKVGKGLRMFLWQQKHSTNNRSNKKQRNMTMHNGVMRRRLEPRHRLVKMHTWNKRLKALSEY